MYLVCRDRLLSVIENAGSRWTDLCMWCPVEWLILRPKLLCIANTPLSSIHLPFESTPSYPQSQQTSLSHRTDDVFASARRAVFLCEMTAQGTHWACKCCFSQLLEINVPCIHTLQEQLAQKVCTKILKQ